MKTQNATHLRRSRAFTLIELLVVIAIIGILAALLFPAGAAIKKGATRKKAKAELQAMVLAIDSYKSKFGYYPPATNALQNSLYFELSGVVNSPASDVAANNWFQTLDGTAKMTAADCQSSFGTGAIHNCSKGGGDDNGQPAVPFLKNLKPGQYCELAPNARLLTCSVAWPTESGPLVPGIEKTANPWRYVVTGATNNPGHYDLWVDIVLGGKTNRISNWNNNYEIVP